MAETNNIPERVREKILGAENILVALSKDPTVDEMAGAIGLTLALDGSGKHATAIYSGKTPDVLRFLNPDKTFETDTNSLQDFIIALNKDKADHLRYKVEGDYVRVYITPYKTRISEKDLEFSHGDFNVDLVVALNIDSVENLDAALSEYGRIMHDATSINITTGQAGKFAELEWSDPAKSSVSEMLVGMLSGMKGVELDKEMATAFMTGIVAATDRFSNDRTVPETMAVAGELMKAGADQKLIADSMILNGMGGDDSVSGGGVAVGMDAGAAAGNDASAGAGGDGEAKISLRGGEGAMGGEGVAQQVVTDEAQRMGESGAVTDEAQSATEQLEQMIKPPEEDLALEQLRQVANDVKPPEFTPGQNPAQVVAPEVGAKEANDIPEMNFGGGDAANGGDSTLDQSSDGDTVKRNDMVNIAPPAAEGGGSGDAARGSDTVNLVPPSEQPKEGTLPPVAEDPSEPVGEGGAAGGGDLVGGSGAAGDELVAGGQEAGATEPLVAGQGVASENRGIETAELPTVTVDENQEASAPAEEEKKDDMPIMGLDDIQLPPPPAPPVSMDGETAPELPQVEIKEGEALPQVEVKETEPLVDLGDAGQTEGGVASAEGAGTEAKTDGDEKVTVENLVDMTGGDDGEMKKNEGVVGDDLGAFKIPGM